MTFTPLSLRGAFLVQLPAFADHRGLFVKTFQESMFQEAGIDFTLRESYFSRSEKDVIRGMHFQNPPHQHRKIVFCPEGAILDVIVDLRRQSPSYGRYEARELSAANQQALYIPEGFAHGFKALSQGALTYYLVSSEYKQEQDTGIRYDSFGFDWGLERPLISERDLSFAPLPDFQSLF